MSDILVVDDDELSRELLVLMLESEGHAAVSVSSGEEAIQALQTGTVAAPSIILTDLQMPGISGDQLAGQLRALCPQVSLLAMSGTEPKERIFGFDGFLLKPFTSAQLLAAMERPEKPPANLSGTLPEAAAGSVLDHVTYRTLATSMKAAQLRQLYEISMADTLRRIQLLRAAAALGDEAAFVREAHSIQGGCGLIGALEVRSLARAMEFEGLSKVALLDQISTACGRLQRMLDSMPEL